MEKVTTSERLNLLMKERRLRQVDILALCKPYCEKYNVKLEKNDLSQYVSGKVQPRQDKLSILGLALGVTEAWLMGFDVPMKSERVDVGDIANIVPLPTTKVIPLLGDIACGEPILAEENISEYVKIPDYINADFALTCKGDSMINARIIDGDIVYIHEQPMVDNGEIAAVLIDNEATLKRVLYYPEKKMVILKPENPQYKDFVYIGEELNSIRILGKAVWFSSKIQ